MCVCVCFFFLGGGDRCYTPGPHYASLLGAGVLYLVVLVDERQGIGHVVVSHVNHRRAHPTGPADAGLHASEKILHHGQEGVGGGGG